MTEQHLITIDVTIFMCNEMILEGYSPEVLHSHRLLNEQWSKVICALLQNLRSYLHVGMPEK